MSEDVPQSRRADAPVVTDAMLRAGCAVLANHDFYIDGFLMDEEVIPAIYRAMELARREEQPATSETIPPEAFKEADAEAARRAKKGVIGNFPLR
jgi:hypothetical protein